MASKTSARIQFLCEKRQLNFQHDLPSLLVGPRALANRKMGEMFELTMQPIVQMHAKDGLEACEDKCSSKGCERDATTIVATAMSYLHKTEDPFVIVMTVACCGTPTCGSTLRREARDLMAQMTGTSAAQPMCSFEFAPMARNGKCYCGSSRKFKKCCGKDAEEEAAGKGAAPAAKAPAVAAT